MGIRLLDVRIEGRRIAEITTSIKPRRGETVVDAAGGALLPALYDHHIHLLSLAKALDSIPCGQPDVSNEAQLVALLKRHATTTPDDGRWMRGIGYHESVAGEIDRAWLDRVVPDRPLRIQHRSGRLWMVNSAGLARIAAGLIGAPAGVDVARGRFQDADDWLRSRLPNVRPSLRDASMMLAERGVIGVTDATPTNGLLEFRHFADEHALGHLVQDVLVMGGAELDGTERRNGVAVGPTKMHLHESALPDFDIFSAAIRHSHAVGRAVAVHCVTVAELVFAASALAEAGRHPGDRIEHASLTPPETLRMLAHQGITVVTQPNFVFERGDTYLDEVPEREQAWLYRGRGFLDRNVPLAAGTDAPFGNADPWLAMSAAVARRTQAGHSLNTDEAISPEEALALFTGPAGQPGNAACSVGEGAIANLCLLDRPWRDARDNLATVQVRATFHAGTLIYGPQ